MAFVGRLSGSDAHPYMNKLVVPVTGALAFKSSIATYQGHAPFIAAVDDGTRVALSCSVPFSASALWVNGSEITSGGGGGSGNVTMASNTTIDNVIVITNGTEGKAVQQANATISTGGSALTVSGSSGILMKVLGVSQAGSDANILVVSGSSPGSNVFGVGMGVGSPNKNQLTIAGSVSASSGLFLGGDAIFNDNIWLSGNVESALSIDGLVSASSGLHVKGDAVFGDALRVSGNLHVGGTFAPGLVSASSGLHVKGDAVLGDALRVSGSVVVGGEIDVGSEGINITDGSLTITSSAQLGPGQDYTAGTFLGIYGAANYNAGAEALLVVSGGHAGTNEWGVGIGTNTPRNARLEVDGLISGSSGLHLKGEALFGDIVRASGSLVVGGLISGSSGLHLKGEALFGDIIRASGSLAVGGLISGSSGLHVGHDAIIAGNCRVSGSLIAGGLITGSSGLHLGGEALFGDAIRASGSLRVGGPVYTTKLRTISNTTVTALDANDYLVDMAGSPGGAQTVALPTASAATGQTILIKRTSDQNVTIWAHGGNIDGYASTATLPNQGEAASFISNGSTWIQLTGMQEGGE
tara:strand:+ start:1774 stop:3519 length:1746 start_codon:yes stop_codon:yes gene_type:complete